MIATTEALVLRISPFSRTSHIVTWLTPAHGQLATVIKGAVRPKSAFLGQYDLFYTCELTYYEKERNGLHIAKECSPLHIRPAFRSDWRAAACASYVADMLARVSISGGHETDLYALGVEVLDELSLGQPDPVLLPWFELALTRVLGLAPQLSSCLDCSSALPPSSAPFFVATQGGLVCAACHAGHPRGGVPLSQGVLAILRRWQRAATATGAARTRCSTDQLVALQQLLALFLAGHIDVSLRSRQLAIDMSTSRNT